MSDALAESAVFCTSIFVLLTVPFDPLPTKYKLPPIYTSFANPAPPDTCNAPLVCVLFTAFNVLKILTAPADPPLPILIVGSTLLAKFTVLAAPNALTVVAIVSNKFWLSCPAPPTTVLLRNVSVLFKLPMLIAVASPNALTVVAVVL